MSAGIKARHFLSLSELGPETIYGLAERALAFANRTEQTRQLDKRIVGIYFRGSSTRTRTAFMAGALRLGGQIIQYGPNDLQVVTGETMEDTGRVLSNYLDALVVRTNGPQAEMKALARQSEMAVINAMSEDEHPTQAMADMTTMLEEFGRFDGIHLLYFGEGNNSAVALAFAIAQTPGMRLTLVTPEGYGIPRWALERARQLALRNRAEVSQQHRLDELPRGVEVVYTTRWMTMGVAKQELNWREKFEPYRVTPALMEKVSKPSGTIFMHDLPAIRGSEVLNEVLDGAQSRALRQAYHKLTSAMAILEWCLSGEG